MRKNNPSSTVEGVRKDLASESYNARLREVMASLSPDAATDRDYLESVKNERRAHLNKFVRDTGRIFSSKQLESANFIGRVAHTAAHLPVKINRKTGENDLPFFVGYTFYAKTAKEARAFRGKWPIEPCTILRSVPEECTSIHLGMLQNYANDAALIQTGVATKYMDTLAPELGEQHYDYELAQIESTSRLILLQAGIGLAHLTLQGRELMQFVS